MAKSQEKYKEIVEIGENIRQVYQSFCKGFKFSESLHEC